MNKYNEYSKKRERLYDMQDSLRNVEKVAEDLFDYQQDLKEDLEDFDVFFSDDIGDWTINKDTLMGHAFMLSKDTPSNDNFELSNFSGAGSETDKVSMYKMSIELNPKASSSYDRLKVTHTESFKERYLQGGMLMDYKTARAYRTTNPGGYIIFSRDIIGDKGKLLVSRIDTEGKQLWQVDAAMSFDVAFAMATKTHLIIGGIINQDKKPSFVNADGLRIIDLKTGALVTVKY